MLITGVSEAIQNEAKEQMDELGALSTLGTSLLGYLLSCKGIKAKILEKGVMRAVEGTIRADEGTISAAKWPHTLTNFEIHKYYQSEPKFNGAYARNNLPKIKDVINLDEYQSIRTHWIVLYVNGENATYSDSFGVEHVPKRN